MKIIEPCCAARHMMELRDALGKKGTADFFGYGDLSFAEILSAVMPPYSETELLIVAPAVPELAAEEIARWMRKQWARMDGRGKLDAVSRLTLITDARKKKSPVVYGWQKENPFGERMRIVSRQQEDTAIVLPDFAVFGPLNMRYAECFTATATTDPERVKELWERYAVRSDK